MSEETFTLTEGEVKELLEAAAREAVEGAWETLKPILELTQRIAGNVETYEHEDGTGTIGFDWGSMDLNAAELAAWKSLNPLITP